jgi:hypothetical protein
MPSSADAVVKDLVEQANVLFQANLFADFVEMFSAHARTKFGVVQEKIGKLGSLLHKIDFCHARSAALELFRRNADDFAQHVARVVERKCLIEIAGE